MSPEAVSGVAAERLRQWSVLTGDEQQRIVDLAGHVLAKRWEAAQGFSIDDRMRATIAAQAALLALGRDADLFRNVTAIVVHPRTMVLRGERRGPIPGVMTRAPWPVHGHTSAQGPVFVAWNEVERTLRRPGGTRNVVLHEFAHKVDALNGTLDGTPPIADRGQREAWIQVCTEAFHAVQRREGIGVLDAYAGRNPSEFFAVATEAFLEQPVRLREEDPDLYEVLQTFYRQDPAAREPAPGDE